MDLNFLIITKLFDAFAHATTLHKCKKNDSKQIKSEFKEVKTKIIFGELVDMIGCASK